MHGAAMSDRANTRLAAIHAFEGPGLQPNVFPDLDEQALSEYIGELAAIYIAALPRSLRREHKELLLDTFVRLLGRGFWAGAAYVVARDEG